MKAYEKNSKRCLEGIITLTLFLFVSLSCAILDSKKDDYDMANEDKHSDEIVILVHGMGRTRFSMILLDRYLKRNGYTTTSYSYRSTRNTIDQSSAKFADFLIETSENTPDKKLHIVTHSLGGILTREALVKVDTYFDEAKHVPVSSKQALPIHKINIGRIVMLAPPNKGSKAANFFSKFWPIPKILKPITELRNSEDSPINDVPVPQNVDIGVIAGRFDRKVTPAESHLDSEKDHIVVNSSHSFIMNNRNVQIAVKNFLKNGHFGTKK